MTDYAGPAALRTLGEMRFDTDHAEFADLIAQLVAASDADIEAALARVQAHAARHFGEEDAELRALGGTANECHLDEHKAVLASMEQVAEIVKTGRFEIARTLGRELAHWLPGHIEELDLRLAQAMFKVRTGGAQVQIFKPGQLASQE